ncbi:MAG: protein translocase subunit SecF, partial [Anaerolineales bacterium]|nr:protein translocase subunit SecF [Anaerolineales bacterium]
FGLSLILIIPGMVTLITQGLPLSIDFTGGSLLEFQFESGELPQPAEVIVVYDRIGIDDALVQTTGQDSLVVKSSFLDDSTRGQIIAAIEEQFSQKLIVLRFDSVGPTIGQEVTARAALAIAVAALAVIVYITYAFRSIEHSLRYGICAIIAMLHDVLIVISLGAITGLLLGWQINALFLTALLTVIGFSVQDKIVVFDRIRENSNVYPRLPFETLVNHSVIQTLQRSINTQLMTVEFMLLAIVLFGGVTLREFALILLVGLLSGTYSSIFIAAPTLVIWDTQEWKSWFRRQPREAPV